VVRDAGRELLSVCGCRDSLGRVGPGWRALDRTLPLTSNEVAAITTMGAGQCRGVTSATARAEARPDIDHVYAMIGQSERSPKQSSPTISVQNQPFRSGVRNNSAGGSEHHPPEPRRTAISRIGLKRNALWTASPILLAPRTMEGGFF